ncbi:MAG TPA: hypothetical protein VGP94_02925 [Tepidisphaeraceae bacterium]|nr:hypothetical protein [Tepidisphaeraceae bacterium]
MGQVAIDLPDPLHNSDPAPGPGVDDLLAQLAGEEIDRLLAEADVERPLQPAITPIPPPVILVPSEPTVSPINSANTVASAPSAADPAQFEDAPASAATATSSSLAQADVEELDARVAQELNSLFTELDSDKPASAPAQPTAAPPPAPIATAAEVAVAAVLAAVPAPPSDPVAQAQALEKQLMGKTLMDALGDPAEVERATSRLKSINLSFLLRPLEWVNAPLSACSDTFREGLGKVAIMTLINALAILLYVMFLRKH